MIYFHSYPVNKKRTYAKKSGWISGIRRSIRAGYPANLISGPAPKRVPLNVLKDCLMAFQECKLRLGGLSKLNYCNPDSYSFYHWSCYESIIYKYSYMYIYPDISLYVWIYLLNIHNFQFNKFHLKYTLIQGTNHENLMIFLTEL